jgi:hypothetical protein
MKASLHYVRERLPNFLISCLFQKILQLFFCLLLLVKHTPSDVFKERQLEKLIVDLNLLSLDVKQELLL